MNVIRLAAGVGARGRAAAGAGGAGGVVHAAPSLLALQLIGCIMFAFSVVIIIMNRVNLNVMSQGPQTYDAAVVAVAADLNSLRKELPDMEAAFEIGPSREEIQLQQSLLLQQRKQAEAKDKIGKASRLKYGKAKSTAQLPGNSGDPVKKSKASVSSRKDGGEGKRVSIPKKENSTDQSLELKDRGGG